MEILILVALIAVNALFAMAEMAVVSSRKARLQPLADAGNRGARAALGLHAQPSVFLSTVQVGITVVGITSGVVGESTIAEPFAAWLARQPGLAAYADEIALTLTVIGITYFSVVVGELVPKRLALRAPETIAALVAIPMTWLARLARPLVWIFSTSSEIILRVLGAEHRAELPVSNAEIEVLMEQGAEAGVFHASEQELVSNILRLDEQRIGVIMTPRIDIEFVDLSDEPATITRTILETACSRVVVCRGGLEHVLGVLPIVDLLKRIGGTANVTSAIIETALRPALFIPKSSSTIQLLGKFRRSRQQFALVVGEYGEVQGVVTLTDVVTSIVGDLEPDRPANERDIIERDDGSWLCDGSIAIEQLKFKLSITDVLPAEREEDFHTLGGFVMHALGHIPRETEAFVVDGYRFEVIDMDAHRIDKVLVTRLASATEAHAEVNP